jgi:hypothetical protein
VVDGREICRSTLLGDCFVFGSPSSILLRAADIRARPAFYNEQNLHADTEVCFDLLRDADLGFVHQILTRSRVHAEAMTPVAIRINTFHHAWLAIHLKYGEMYLERNEYFRRLMYLLRRYAVFLGKAVVKAKVRDPEFRKHHRFALVHLLRSVHVWRAAPSRRKPSQSLSRPRSSNDERRRPALAAADEDPAERE